MVEIAEDKFKIALIDLLRLLMMHEHTAAHILNRHWNTIEVTIFGYLECMDIKDTSADARVMHNYHLVCLKMLANIYLTESGKDFMQGDDASAALIKFCQYSIQSITPKVVFHAAILLFNHVLCYKRDKSNISQLLENALLKINELFADSSLVDFEASIALLLCECRILYTNKWICERITEKFEDIFKKNHQILELRVKNQKVKEAIDDVFMMLFD